MKIVIVLFLFLASWVIGWAMAFFIPLFLLGVEGYRLYNGVCRHDYMEGKIKNISFWLCVISIILVVFFFFLAYTSEGMSEEWISFVYTLFYFVLGSLTLAAPCTIILGLGVYVRTESNGTFLVVTKGGRKIRTKSFSEGHKLWLSGLQQVLAFFGVVENIFLYRSAEKDWYQLRRNKLFGRFGRSLNIYSCHGVWDTGLFEQKSYRVDADKITEWHHVEFFQMVANNYEGDLQEALNNLGATALDAHRRGELPWLVLK